MAPLPLTVAKNMHTHFLLRVRRKIATLKAFGKDPEILELDRLSTATGRLEEAWRRYENSQQDVLNLVAEDKVEGEQVTFIEMKEIYEAVKKESAADKKPDEEVTGEEAAAEDAPADDTPAAEVEAAPEAEPMEVATEDEASDELLMDTAAQEDVSADDAPGHDLSEWAKEAGLEEMHETEDEAPDELLRDIAAQEDTTADNTAGYDLRVLATKADLGSHIDPEATAMIRQDHCS